jgi:hypothetical protein
MRQNVYSKEETENLEGGSKKADLEVNTEKCKYRPMLMSHQQTAG